MGNGVCVDYDSLGEAKLTRIAAWQQHSPEQWPATHRPVKYHPQWLHQAPAPDHKYQQQEQAGSKPYQPRVERMPYRTGQQRYPTDGIPQEVEHKPIQPAGMVPEEALLHGKPEHLTVPGQEMTTLGRVMLPVRLSNSVAMACTGDRHSKR